MYEDEIESKGQCGSPSARMPKAQLAVNNHQQQDIKIPKKIPPAKQEVYSHLKSNLIPTEILGGTNKTL